MLLDLDNWNVFEWFSSLQTTLVQPKTMDGRVNCSYSVLKGLLEYLPWSQNYFKFQLSLKINQGDLLIAVRHKQTCQQADKTFVQLLHNSSTLLTQLFYLWLSNQYTNLISSHYCMYNIGNTITRNSNGPMKDKTSKIHGMLFLIQ